MNSYTITIAPNDDSGNTTVLVVDTSGDEVRITDVHLHAGGGLSGGQLPTVDFGLLLRAVTATKVPQPIEAAPVDPPVPAESGTPTAAATTLQADTPTTPPTGRAPRARRRAATAVPEPAAAPPARRGRGGRASAAKTAAAPTAAPASARKANRATKATTGKGERAYRRMPEDFTAVHEHLGTAATVAEHYGVPRHTVNAWLRRLRASTPPAAEKVR